MGRRMRPVETPPDLGGLLRHCLSLADAQGFGIVAAHIASAIDHLGVAARMPELEASQAAALTTSERL